LTFGGLRINNFKALYSAKDTWLGPNLNLAFPSLYNLWWDPGENYDMIFNGAAPTRGDLRTSPGRFSGSDHGWVTLLLQPKLDQFFGELLQYPNRPTLPTAGSANQIIDNVNNPPELRRLMLLLEPSSQITK